MSIKNWNAGIIRPVPVAPTGPYQDSSAPGVWTLDQQAYWDKQNLWPTAGNVNPDAFIENIFSTYLYAGNSSTQTITNGIDLSGKGGLVWLKNRGDGTSHALFDTARGSGYVLNSNATSAQGNTSWVGMFNSDGFDVEAGGTYNGSGYNYVSWTFRKQAKFFDVVTWTGNSAAQTINHNLGSAPGVIFVKSTAASADWWVYHRSLSSGYYMVLNSTAAQTNSFAENVFGNGVTVVAPTATQFTVGPGINLTGGMIAYLFAHDAGGFGLTGTDNVITCGSFTTDGSGNATVNLGYEPQFVMFKSSSNTGSWAMVDTMRGMSVNPSETNKEFLYANLSNAASVGSGIGVTSTGFNMAWFANQTFIYIAIRRGPMQTPTSGTQVFKPDYWFGTSTSIAGYLGAPADVNILGYTGGSVANALVRNRLTDGMRLTTSSTGAEADTGSNIFWANMLGFYQTSGTLSTSFINWTFRRAPGFFDVVCYSGTSSTTTVAHNLAVVPELIIVKMRNDIARWWVYAAPIGTGKWLGLNETGAVANYAGMWTPAPTSTNIGLGPDPTNFSTYTYVAYLFASCPGVSKVGSYTGTGALQTVNCGFTTGARFVLIKRTDSTGDWWTYDSARGITSGNDPYLLLNSTAAEVTGTNYVDTASTGFQVTAAAPAGLNANGGTYIFLAIA